MSAVGSWRWQAGLLGMTVLGALYGVAALVATIAGHPPRWARDGEPPPPPLPTPS